jgi:hypothetical protein
VEVNTAFSPSSRVDTTMIKGYVSVATEFKPVLRMAMKKIAMLNETGTTIFASVSLFRRTRMSAINSKKRDEPRAITAFGLLLSGPRMPLVRKIPPEFANITIYRMLLTRRMKSGFWSSGDSKYLKMDLNITNLLIVLSF